jgi:Core-2/I-Branching enzyme
MNDIKNHLKPPLTARTRPQRRPRSLLATTGTRCSLLLASALLLFSLLPTNNFVVVVVVEAQEEGKTQERLLRERLRVDVLDSLPSSTMPLGRQDSADPREAAQQVLHRIVGAGLQDRLTKIFEKAKTRECRAKIAEHFSYFINAIGEEEGMPFADAWFNNTCPEPVYMWEDLPEGMHVGHVQNRTYQPPRDEAEYIDDPAHLKLCYAILTHDSPESTIRLIEALYEEGHVFVIHVDGKESSEATYQRLVEYASTRDYVHILAHPHRVRVNWGGFSMVNATMQILRYIFAVDDDADPQNNETRQRRPALDFHKLVHVASTSYPLASNSEIRHQLAAYPLDANFLNVIMKPTRPGQHGWFYFVECDDALHRIYRLPSPQNETAGMELFTASQWFIISREFAQYMAEAKPGTFVHQFLEYAEHVVVADETFFGTVLRHTEFCLKHQNRNYLHLQFDRWESDLPSELRDERKCMMKDPNHCGRSPTTMTVDYVDILELSDDLFARKVSTFCSPLRQCVRDDSSHKHLTLTRLVWDSNGSLWIPTAIK